MSSALSLPMNTFPAVIDGLDSYLQKVHAVPLLTAEEEKALALRYREAGDLMAAQQLVLSHLRYVVRIGRGYNGYGLALSDLIQEGTIGLMKAVKRFDPEVGVRLVSFAVHWIKSEIHDYVIRNWRIVKVATTKAQRKLFFNLRSLKEAKKRLGWFSMAEVEAVATDLGVTVDDVKEMECRLNAHDDSLDPFQSDEMGLGETSFQEPDEVEIQGKLSSALEALDSRSLEIVSNRYLSDSKTSLKELAEKYDISIERVRQIEKAAIKKLRDEMSDLPT